MVGAAFEIAGTDGADALGVGRVCLAAGLTKRYFYESFASLAELQSAVVDHAIAVMSERVDPFRPIRPGGPPQGWIEAFVGALVDDQRLARVLLAETHGGALSPFRHQIIDVAVAGMAPPGSDPQADLRARLVAFAQIGTLSELCLAWHQGQLVDGADGTCRRAGRSVRPYRGRSFWSAGPVGIRGLPRLKTTRGTAPSRLRVFAAAIKERPGGPVDSRHPRGR